MKLFGPTLWTQHFQYEVITVQVYIVSQWQLTPTLSNETM